MSTNIRQVTTKGVRYNYEYYFHPQMYNKLYELVEVLYNPKTKKLRVRDTSGELDCEASKNRSPIKSEFRTREVKPIFLKVDEFGRVEIHFIWTLKARSEIDDKVATINRTKKFLSFKSRHEIMGMVTEYFKELESSLSNEDLNIYKDRLANLGAICSLGIASIISEKLDW